MRRLAQVGVSVLLLAGGLGCAGLLVMLSPSAERADLEAPRLTVRVATIAPATHGAVVEATGVVAPERRVAISAQVAGAVVHVAPQLRPGGRFAKGEVIARIDPRDYDLAIAAEASRLAQAELELRIERGRSDVARREWELLGRDATPDQAAVIRREPHLAVAEAAVEAARSGLERARLARERTAIRAPFNAIVEADQVDLGQVLAPGSPVAVLIGSDRFRVEVAVPADALGLLHVPGLGDGQASAARVVSRHGARPTATRDGYVTGLAGRLDPQTRMARVHVGIDEPLDHAEPLFPDAFVEVTLWGRAREGVVAVPRVAVVDGADVWVVTPEDRLARRSLEVAWRDTERVFATSGLLPGDRVVTVPLSLPIDGMAVNVLDQED